MWYATLAQAKQEQIVPDSDTSGDAALMEILAQVTARIDVETHRSFAPSYRVRSFHAHGSHLNFGMLDVGSLPFLELSGLTLSGSALVLDTDYYLMEHESPYFTVDFESYPFASDWRNALALTGIWGYRTNYSTEAWQRSSATVNETFSSSDTTLTVSAATSFSPGQRIRIDTEFVDVTAISGSNLTVTRGAGGSTAAAHASATAIDIWIPELPITRACLRWAAFQYQRRGHYSPVQIDAIGGTIVSRYPPDMPEEVQNILKLYTAWSIGTP